jgi:N-acetylmuramoyl-L-alanine amidase-like protein
MARYSAATWKPIGSGGTVRMNRYDLLVVHTMVGNLVGTDNYFRQQPNNSHFGLGGQWGADASAKLDGRLYQWVDTAFRSAATREGNPRVIAVECADNAPANPGGIKPFTDAQCDALVGLMVWAHKTHGIPLVAAHDSKPGTVGIGWHKLGCDPYRVSGGELWSSAYGKVCPGDARIAQIPRLIARAQAIVNGTNQEDEVSVADVETALKNVLHIDELAVPKGQANNNQLAVLLVGASQQEFNANGQIKAALGQLQTALSAVEQDTSVTGDDETAIKARIDSAVTEIKAAIATLPQSPSA